MFNVRYLVRPILIAVFNLQMREGDLYNLLKGFGGVLSALALALEKFTEGDEDVPTPKHPGNTAGPSNSDVSAFFRQLSVAFAERFSAFRV